MTESHGAQSAGHRLTRLAADDRRAHQRVETAIACRVEYTRQGVRGIEVLLGVTGDVSAAGARVVLNRPAPPLEYVTVRLAGDRRARGARVRRRANRELGLEFLEAMNPAAFAALLAANR